MRATILFLTVAILLAGALSTSNGQEAGEMKRSDYGVFSFWQSVTLPGAPGIIYDAITGDISGWWDHTFSGKPARFFIEPKPGGGFYPELFMNLLRI
ncbi:MAG: hypothetical protein ACOY90_01615 [Candidatus Zhuqueibacterota bacterium]